MSEQPLTTPERGSRCWKLQTGRIHFWLWCHFNWLHQWCRCKRMDFCSGIQHDALSPQVSPTIWGREKQHSSLFYAEDLGFAPPRLCNDCKMCHPCRINQGNFNHEEAQPVREVEENTQLNKASWNVSTSYPWRPEVASMISNKAHVQKVHQATEARIAKQGHTEQYIQ